MSLGFQMACLGGLRSMFRAPNPESRGLTLCVGCGHRVKLWFMREGES